MELKGRVACEINSGFELLLTEMIFHGVFNDLTTPQAVALLSCFVYDRPKSSNEAPNRLEQEIQGPMRATKVGF